MPWSTIIEQTRVTSTLQSVIESGRAGHAYLFYGPEGSGKMAVAIEFAAALQCERGGGEACGKCLACTKVARLIHPDVRVLFPTPGKEIIEEERERVALLAKNHYAVVDFARKPNIDGSSKATSKHVIYPVDRIRELIRLMSLRSVEGRFKVVIVFDAHFMRAEAANAFLKLLEEPPGRTVFILMTSRPDQLLPTIVSRCQKLRFDTLSDEGIASALQDRENVDEARAALLARMAGGSYSRALELTQDEQLIRNRERIIDFLRSAYGRRYDDLSLLVDDFSATGRDGVKALLGLLIIWVRDLLHFRITGSTDGITNIDQAEVIRKFCLGVPSADLEKMIDLIQEAVRLVERNVGPQLILVVLADSLREAMHGKSETRLYVPLAEPDQM
jgi:DNA polymerase III subunit delta'